MIRRRHRDPVALAGLVLGRLPVLYELTSGRVVSQHRVAGSHRLDRIFGSTNEVGTTGVRVCERLDDRSVRNLGGSSKHLELERNCRATLDRVHDSVHVDWLVEAGTYEILDCDSETGRPG